MISRNFILVAVGILLFSVYVVEPTPVETIPASLLSDLLGGLIGNLQKVLGSIFDEVGGLVGTLGNVLTSGLDRVVGLVVGLLNQIGGLADGLFSGLRPALENLLGTLLNGIVTVVTKLLDAIGKLLQGLLGGVVQNVVNSLLHLVDQLGVLLRNVLGPLLNIKASQNIAFTDMMAGFRSSMLPIFQKSQEQMCNILKAENAPDELKEKAQSILDQIKELTLNLPYESCASENCNKLREAVQNFNSTIGCSN